MLLRHYHSAFSARPCSRTTREPSHFPPARRSLTTPYPHQRLTPLAASAAPSLIAFLSIFMRTLPTTSRPACAWTASDACLRAACASAREAREDDATPSARSTSRDVASAAAAAVWSGLSPPDLLMLASSAATPPPPRPLIDSSHPCGNERAAMRGWMQVVSI